MAFSLTPPLLWYLIVVDVVFVGHVPPALVYAYAPHGPSMALVAVGPAVVDL